MSEAVRNQVFWEAVASAIPFALLVGLLVWLVSYLARRGEK